MVGALQVTLDDEVMLMSQSGTLVRTPVKDISVVGRNTQGVRLIRLEEGDELSGLERVAGLGAEAAEGDAEGDPSDSGGEDPGDEASGGDAGEPGDPAGGSGLPPGES
jgi:DNA gyrase subunit A